MRKILLLSVLLFTACTQTQVVKNPPPHFLNGPTITLDVGRVDIVDDYKAPGAKPNVEHLFEYRPSDVFKTWVSEHIKAGGGPNILEVTIKDASVIATQLPEGAPVTEFFTRDQGWRYDGKLWVEMRVFKQGSAVSDAQVSSTATRSVTTPENATLLQRDKLFYDISTGLTRTISQQLDQDIQRYFSAFIK